MFDNPFAVAIVSMICGAVITIGLPIARAYARRIESSPPALPPETAARLERMELALDAVAVEIERISEGQRFTTRLLAERTEAAARPGGFHAQ